MVKGIRPGRPVVFGKLHHGPQSASLTAVTYNYSESERENSWHDFSGCRRDLSRRSQRDLLHPGTRSRRGFLSYRCAKAAYDHSQSRLRRCCIAGRHSSAANGPKTKQLNITMLSRDSDPGTDGAKLRINLFQSNNLRAALIARDFPNPATIRDTTPVFSRVSFAGCV